MFHATGSAPNNLQLQGFPARQCRGLAPCQRMFHVKHSVGSHGEHLANSEPIMTPSTSRASHLFLTIGAWTSNLFHVKHSKDASRHGTRCIRSSVIQLAHRGSLRRATRTYVSRETFRTGAASSACPMPGETRSWWRSPSPTPGRQSHGGTAPGPSAQLAQSRGFQRQSRRRLEARRRPALPRP